MVSQENSVPGPGDRSIGVGADAAATKALTIDFVFVEEVAGIDRWGGATKSRDCRRCKFATSMGEEFRGNRWPFENISIQLFLITPFSGRKQEEQVDPDEQAVLLPPGFQVLLTHVRIPVSEITAGSSLAKSDLEGRGVVGWRRHGRDRRPGFPGSCASQRGWRADFDPD